MNKGIDRLKASRKFFLNLTADLTPEQWNEKPPGFNNNPVWNLGHMITSQQSVCYLRAELTPRIDEKYFLSYNPGTKPEHFVDQLEIDLLKHLFTETIAELEKDIQSGLFTNYQAYQTRSGFDISGIDDGVNYVLFHDGLHAGYVMAQKRSLKKLS